MSRLQMGQEEIPEDEQVEARSLFVRLAAVGNPDRGQDPDSPLFGVGNIDRHAVSSLREASRACSEYISANNLGSGNWDGGDVFDDDGRAVARVSYNGRVWAVERSSERPKG